MLISGELCQVAQSCPNLCNPMDCSPPGSSVHGILWARILEWVAISFSTLQLYSTEKTFKGALAEPTRPWAEGWSPPNSRAWYPCTVRVSLDPHGVASVPLALILPLLLSCVVYVPMHSSHVRLFETPWTLARQTPLFMEFSRQENRSG